MKRKYGSLLYLAMWQGMREEDLCINFIEGATLVCARTGVKVFFTADLSKLDADASEDGETDSTV